MVSFQHVDGTTTPASVAHLENLYEELASAKRGGGPVAVRNGRNGWAISAYADGHVVLENLEDSDEGEERHMADVPSEHVIELWQKLLADNVRGILEEPWRSGYGMRSPASSDGRKR